MDENRNNTPETEIDEDTKRKLKIHRAFRIAGVVPGIIAVLLVAVMILIQITK